MSSPNGNQVEQLFLFSAAIRDFNRIIQEKNENPHRIIKNSDASRRFF